jgi:hypothetical protein
MAKMQAKAGEPATPTEQQTEARGAVSVLQAQLTRTIAHRVKLQSENADLARVLKTMTLQLQQEKEARQKAVTEALKMRLIVMRLEQEAQGAAGSASPAAVPATPAEAAAGSADPGLEVKPPTVVEILPDMDEDAAAMPPAHGPEHAAVDPDAAPSEAETVPGEVAPAAPKVAEAPAPASRMGDPAAATQPAASSQPMRADAITAGAPTPEIVDAVPPGAGGNEPTAPGREVASPSEASSAGGADARAQQLSQLLDRMQRMQSMMGRMAQLMMPQPTLMEMQLLQAMAPPPPVSASAEPIGGAAASTGEAMTSAGGAPTQATAPPSASTNKPRRQMSAAGSAAIGPVAPGAEQPEAEPAPDVSASPAPTTDVMPPVVIGGAVIAPRPRAPSTSSSTTEE